MPFTHLHEKQLIPKAGVVFSWVFLLKPSKDRRCKFELLSIATSALLILTENMSSYMSTTFSFKGFLEDDVLLSKPAFFST